MQALPKSTAIGVVGAGTMGAGIAQVAASAGHPVLIFDSAPGAASEGRQRVANGLAKLVDRGRMTATEAEALVGRIEVCEERDKLANAGLIIEAIVEDLKAKRELFHRLEQILSGDAILATNTSSISVTAIGAQMKSPSRLAGLHFFNPAPVMKLVEVISGLATSPEVASKLVATVHGWGKIPVRARSTPGFIVNRVARPFYGEALRLVEEQVADPATIDALLTEGGGFRMGPFALMDLIGNDVNFAVSNLVYNGYYQDPRFRPSFIQREYVDAGWLGRKSGRGYYDYSGGGPRPLAKDTTATEKVTCDRSIIARTPLVEHGVLFALTDGRTAEERARVEGRPVVLHDLVFDPASASRVGFTVSSNVDPQAVEWFVTTLEACAVSATQLPDWPGLVVMRTVAALANEAFEAVLHGVGDEAGIDLAMRYGVNYPLGPIEWSRSLGHCHVLNVIEALHDATRDPRYRPSYSLRRAARGSLPVAG